jgi:hypothetical protein
VRAPIGSNWSNWLNAGALLSGEAANFNCVVFDLTQPGLELTIYQAQGEHASHYTTDAVKKIEIISV